MVYCDVVRGTAELVGPFSGMTNLESKYFKDASTIEGKDNEGRYNLYSIYRDMNAALTDAVAADGTFSHARKTRRAARTTTATRCALRQDFKFRRT